ncbi:hypothetical protein M9Y10_041021 [Tritrichomonas musculus]|uniref:Mediator complex subunit 8 n=1 Tax=Tritrichomonas musculus TaxID=1915356 RepID=A0ABR2K3R5_9EUKA
MIRTGSLSDLLKDSEKVREPIMERVKRLQDDMQKKVPFNTLDVKNDLTNELTQFQEYIINLSQRCLSKLNDWNNTLNGMDTEINEYSGIILRTKSEMGSRTITPMLCEGGAPIQQPLDDVLYSENQFQFPSYPFNINMNVLSKVGHQAIESETSQEVANQPLILANKAEDLQPVFWGLQTDLFSPIPEASSTVEQSAYQTSFSNFYGFSPMPDNSGENVLNAQTLESTDVPLGSTIDLNASDGDDDDDSGDEKSDSE